MPLSAQGTLGNVAYIVLTLEDGKPRPILTRTLTREGGGLRLQVEDSRLVELAPEYVDVALRRWLQHHPGTVPVLEGSGRTFAEVAAERLGETAEVTA